MDPKAARTLDELAAAATAADDEAHLDGWWCKAAPALPFRRANVALPPVGLGADPDRLDRGLRTVAAWYRARAVPLRVQVSSADPTAEALDDHLGARGLVVEAPVHVLVTPRPLGSIPDDLAGPAAPAATVTAGIDDAWVERQALLAGADATAQERSRAYGRMLARFGPAAIGATVRRGDEVIGIGFGVIAQGWLGIFGMATAPAARRHGVATAVVAGLEAHASAASATAAYLQVETDNRAAIACYQRLGYVRSHGYHYRSDRGPA
jgi:GNAT superfamily N-acetyltransferase